MTLAPRRAPDHATRQPRTLGAYLSLTGWSWFATQCLRCLRSTYCRALIRQRAPSDFFARAKKSPRNTPDCRDPGPLRGPGFPSLRGFSRAALNSLRLRLRSDIQRPRFYLESSRENSLHLARRKRGGRSRQRPSRRSCQWMKAGSSDIFGTLGLWLLRAAPARGRRGLSGGRAHCCFVEPEYLLS